MFIFALCLMLASFTFPAAAGADVRFGSPLASSASDPAQAAQPPAVAGNAAGAVVAAYVQKDAGVDRLHVRVKPPGAAAPGEVQKLGGSAASFPAAAVAADGTVTVAWHQASPCAGSSVWIATAPPGGGFGLAQKVSDNAFDPHLDVAPSGTVALLYTHDKGSCVQEERAQIRPPGGSAVDVPVSDGAYGNVDGTHAAVGMDDSGTVIAAFVQSLKAAPFTNVLRVARRPAGGIWNATTLSGPGTNGGGLAVSRDGYAVVAYNRKIAAGYAVEVRPLAPGAASFGPPQTVTDLASNHTFGSVAVADGGSAAVTTGDEQLARRTAGNAPFGQAAAPGLGFSASSLTAAFSPRGELVLLDDEKVGAPAGPFSLVARVAPTAGAALGPAQPTGLESDATGSPSVAAFGANNVAAGWQHRPPGAQQFRAGVALGDGTPPELGGVSAPSGGPVATPLAFGVTPKDDLGLADVQWAFGDGATAMGAGVTHAFGAAGGSTWAVTARDLVGNAATASGGLTVAPAPAVVAQPPRLTVRIAKPRRGTRGRRLRYFRGTASGPVARVEVAVVRLLGGAKASAAATRTRALCRSLASTGRLLATARRAGATGCRPVRYLKARGTRRWSLRLRRGLPAGRYAVWARARSASGAKSRVARVVMTLR
jgi:hypothetical protein